MVVFALALTVRLVHLWQMRGTPYFTVLMGDARGYDAWAQRLAAGDWMGADVFYQAPLYPYVLGAVYAVFGHDLMAARLIQALIGSASAVLVGWAAARLFSPPAGVIAGVALALYAPAVFFDGLIQKSVLDVAFVSAALAVIAALVTDSGRTNAPWLALGAAVGALSLTRENALLLAPLLGLWTWRTARRPRALALFAAGVALVLAPVALRNYAVGGGLYLTTSQFGPNFYIGNNAGADGSYVPLRLGRGAPEFEQTDATELAERAVGRALTQGEVSAYWTGRAIAFITGNPAAWLRLQARKAALLVNAAEMLDTESQESHAEWSWPLRLLGPITHFGVLVPLAVVGLWLTWPQRRRLWALYAMGLTFAATTLAFYVFARYRFPLVPLLVVFAAAAVTAVTRDWATWPRAYRLRILGVTAAAAALCFVPVTSAARARAITETNLGAAFHDLGRYDDAAARYRRALEIVPDHVAALNNLGVTLRAQGRVDEAIQTYERALGLGGDYPDVHFNLANALLAQNRTEEAAAHFRQASAGEPDSAAVHNNLGTALAEKGQLVDAAAAFERALLLEPDSARAHRNLGNVLADLGRTAEARRHLERAAALDPRDAEVQYDLGVLLLNLDALDEAVAAFTAALAARPGDADTHNNLGIALGSQQRFDQAVAHFEEALRLRPGFADAAANLETVRRARRAIGVP